MEAFGLPVNKAEITTFGETKALVIERFDRRWTRDSRLIRLPQEDSCQALSVPPTRKYQNDGGPELTDVLELLRGSDNPAADQTTVSKAQILFWLIGTTDGHAKNFSIFINPAGSYHQAPLYDVLTVQPSLVARQITRKLMRLAMALGTRNHYKISDIQQRHFLQSGDKADLPKALVTDAIDDIVAHAEAALEKVESALPGDFPADIHAAVKEAVTTRLRVLQMAP